jgi:hypothetical protein
MKMQKIISRLGISSLTATILALAISLVALIVASGFLFGLW